MMAVNIIRKQSGQANEVTDAMTSAGINAIKHLGVFSINFVDEVFKAMEAARIAEVGEIERIEVVNETVPDFAIHSDGDIVTLNDSVASIYVNNKNLIPLGEVLIELGKQMKGAV